MTQQETRAAIIERLERGFQEVQDSERFQDYLSTCARFHHYSAHNIILIWSQRPDATRVAGFHTWQKLGVTSLKGRRASGFSPRAPTGEQKRKTAKRRLSKAAISSRFTSSMSHRLTVSRYRTRP